ncbi:MAG: response regulator transcription factor [Paramuribaculum sp.]|nr:response regulator transcription factor [Paramuribaculum sp.]
MANEISTSQPKDRLLLIDEDRMSCELLQYKFQTEGFVVDICHSGTEALGKLTPDYNLLLIDLMESKEMDGFQLVNKIKRNPDLFNLPFIFVSKRAGEDDIVSGLDAGADDYIPKPFSARELVARVRSVLRRRKMMSKRRMSNVMNLVIIQQTLGHCHSSILSHLSTHYQLAAILIPDFSKRSFRKCILRKTIYLIPD